MTLTSLTIPSPLGDLTLNEADGALISLDWRAVPRARQSETPLLREAARQMQAYFAGERTSFDLPLRAAGSDFRHRVWQAMGRIPYGATQTYGEMARALGASARAVGGACGANPLPIVVPCHRVVASGGRMGGYSGEGGLDTKLKLLRLEGAAI